MEQFNTKKRVYAHFRKRMNDDLILPQIILQGHYLQKAGYEVGDLIEVNMVGDVITIRKGVESE